MKQVLPARSGLAGLFVYAVVITVSAVIVIVWRGGLAERTGAKPRG